MRALCLLLAGALASCHVTASITYPHLASGAAAHVAVSGPVAYVARGGHGVEVVDLQTRRRVRLVPPAGGSGSADDLSVAEGLLFVLDARSGRLSVFSTEDPADPRLTASPVKVPVGPFSGVSAGAGRVIVSGGTSELTVLTYDTSGHLGAVRATADLGRGQPDADLAADGTRAAVSTHFSGPSFGVVTLLVRPPPEAPLPQGQLLLPGAGFTPGGFKPANFPLGTAFLGDTLFVAHGGGLAVVDITDLRAPRLVRVVQLEVRPVAVAVAADGSVVAVVGSSPTPRVILLDARTLTVRSSRPLPDDAPALGVALTDTQVVIAAGRHGAVIMPR